MNTLKPPRSRRLAMEKAMRGLQLDRSHTAMVVTVAPAAYCTMIAHGPPPSAATVTPAAAPASAPIMGRISTRAKSMSRSIRDCCGAPTAKTTKPIESTWRSGLASASP
jgi:hypothetical protein